MYEDYVLQLLFTVAAHISKTVIEGQVLTKDYD